MTRLLISLCLIAYIEAIQVIGGRRTVVEGQDVDLPCQLVDSQEDLTQVSWQRKTREDPVNHNFYLISPRVGARPVDGGSTDQFQFIGSLADNNGTIQLKRARLLDEGTYTCVFTLFPSGPHRTEIPLTVLVPPVMSVTVGAPPVVGHKEVTVAMCVAAVAKPAAEVRWETGALGSHLRTVTNSTQHQNGTTTVISYLLGVPTRDDHQQPVQCVVTQSALETERTLPYKLNIFYPPLSVNFSKTSPQVLQCVADGNPPPVYTWTRVGQPWPASAVRKGDSLILDLTADLNGLSVCEASNPHGTSTASLYIDLASGSSPVVWVLLGVVITLGLAAAAGLLWYWRKHGTLPRRFGMPSQGGPPARGRHTAEEKETSTPLDEIPPSFPYPRSRDQPASMTTPGSSHLRGDEAF